MKDRRYTVWGGNPRGVPEDTTRCIEVVWETGRSMLSNQCKRKRGHGKDGLYCKQHAMVKKRSEEINKRLGWV